MNGLVDISGKPISSSDFAKAPAPPLGEKFAPNWGSRLEKFLSLSLASSGLIQFDLSKLETADFRTMRSHYQINATLSVMSFMLHEMDWHIECDNPKITALVTANVANMWTQLVRACSQAHWAGRSPCVLQWENDDITSSTQLTKIKDLIPETAAVEWKEVEGYAPPRYLKPKINIYDGIRVWGQGWPVPATNTFWYPLLMENGDMSGTKLLKAAFTPWYFSMLIHLYANRYFERFGEPIPVGRAPYDDEIEVLADGTPKKINGATFMAQTLQNLRNRSVVVLPNQRTPVSNSPTGVGDVQYDYEISYLESQMRGADFDRYLNRLDEEISLSMFTPLLVLRTADVGSYNLGSTHWTTYMKTLNAMSADMKTYIDKFILSRMADFNFGLKSPRPKIVFRKMGSDKMEMIIALIQALIPTGRAMPDLKQLSDIAGLDFKAVKILADPNSGSAPDPAADPKADPADSQDKATTGGTKPAAKPATTAKPNAKKKASSGSIMVLGTVSSRVSAQILKACRESSELASVSFGFNRQLADALTADGFVEADGFVDTIYRMAGALISDVSVEAYQKWSHEEIIDYVSNVLSTCIDMETE